MSGYLPLASKFEERFNKVNADTPVMACHGTHGMSLQIPSSHHFTAIEAFNLGHRYCILSRKS